MLHSHVQAALAAGHYLREESVTQGKRKAVPSGINVNPRARTGQPCASPVAASPADSSTMPRLDNFASPSRSTMRPKQQGPHNDTHATEIHHEKADVLFGDSHARGQQQGHRLNGAVEGADADGIDPDEPRCGSRQAASTRVIACRSVVEEALG